MKKALSEASPAIVRELKSLKEKFSHNTKERGIFRAFIYQEDDRYVGVCLNFDIVVEGDDAQVVQDQLLDACKLHVQVVKEENLSDDLLNRHAPDEYWLRYIIFERLQKDGPSVTRHSPSPYQMTDLSTTISY